jgi:hypothetical protein
VADVLLTYAELTRVFPVAEGTLRAWVSEDRIEPFGARGRRKVFRHNDIQRAYDRRHPEDEETPWVTGTSPSTDTASTTTAWTTTPSNV